MNARDVPAILIVGFLGAGEARGAGLRVPEDYPTIQLAIDAAVSGDSVLVGPGHWTDKTSRVISIGFPSLFTSCAFLKGGVTVIGTAGPDATVIDAEESGAGGVNVVMFANQPGQSCILEGFTVTGAIELAALFAFDCASIRVRGCHVVDNLALGKDGTAIWTDGCDLVIEDSEVGNNVSGSVVAIKAIFGDLEMRRCRVNRNVGSGGVGSSGPTTATDRRIIEECEFVDNRSFGATVGLGEYDVLSIERNVFLRNVTTSTTGAALYVFGNHNIGGSGGTIRFNTFAYDSALYADGGGGLLAAFFNGEITNNTFVGCYAPDPGFQATFAAAGLYSQSQLTFAHNVIVGSSGQPAVQIQGTADQFLIHSCNVFWNNSAGDYSVFDGPPLPPDILADPLFCDPEVLDFTVRTNSPCAPGNVPGCGAIGAWPVGCGSVNVESSSWGKIKALYK